VEGERERERGREKIYTSKCNMQMLYTQLYAKNYIITAGWSGYAKEDEIIHKDSCPWFLS